MSITVTVDVDVDYDEFSNGDILDLIQDRIERYERQERYASTDKDKAAHQKNKKDFINEILESVNRDDLIKPEAGTLLDEQYNELFETMRSKYTLQELQTLLNTIV